MKTSSNRAFGSLLSISALVVVTALAGCSGGSGATTGTPSGSASGAGVTVTLPVPTSSPFWGEPGTASLPAATTAALQKVLETIVDSKDERGITAAVVTPTGTWAGAAGVDGTGTALQPTSAFAIASTTKTFVAAEIMLLAQEGRLDLDKPVADYVTLPFDTHGATIRQLATMTAGLPGFPQATLDALAAKDLTHVFTAAEILELAADQPAAGILGQAPVYSGTPFYALGLVIEKVTGRSLAAALHDDLVAPAGLTRTWMQPEEKPVPPLAISADTGDVQLVDTSGWLPSKGASSLGQGGGGMASDAPDLARWIYLLYGGHVLDRTVVTQMERYSFANDGQAYGFGTMVGIVDGQTLYGHAGNYLGYTSISMVFPDISTSIAVLLPRTGGTGNDAGAEHLFALHDTLVTART